MKLRKKPVEIEAVQIKQPMTPPKPEDWEARAREVIEEYRVLFPEIGKIDAIRALSSRGQEGGK